MWFMQKVNPFINFSPSKWLQAFITSFRKKTFRDGGDLRQWFPAFKRSHRAPTYETNLDCSNNFFN